MVWQGRVVDPTGGVLLHIEDRIGGSDAVQGATYGAAAGGCEKCGLAPTNRNVSSSSNKIDHLLFSIVDSSLRHVAVTTNKR